MSELPRTTCALSRNGYVMVNSHRTSIRPNICNLALCHAPDPTSIRTEMGMSLSRSLTSNTLAKSFTSALKFDIHMNALANKVSTRTRMLG